MTSLQKGYTGRESKQKQHENRRWKGLQEVYSMKIRNGGRNGQESGIGSEWKKRRQIYAEVKVYEV